MAMLTGEQYPRPTRGPASWAVSAVLHGVLLVALVAIRPAANPPDNSRSEIVTPLVYLPPPSHIQAPVPPRLTHIPVRVPQPVAPHTVIVKSLPPVIIERPRAATISAPEPVLQPVAPAEVQIARVKAPELPSRPAPPPAPVKTGVFGAQQGESPNGHTPSPRLEVQTGGFGGSEGSRSAAGVSSGTPGGKGIQTGAFGDSTGAGGAGGHGKSGQIADAGFGNAAAAPPAAAARAQTQANETPVEVLWKPKPAYTSEARAKKLEGNVTLEVVFHASGDIQVLRVVRGLGSGLDESARTAAEQIRFRPGKKDGIPVDRTGLVLITFELS